MEIIADKKRFQGQIKFWVCYNKDMTSFEVPYDENRKYSYQRVSHAARFGKYIFEKEDSLRDVLWSCAIKGILPPETDRERESRPPLAQGSLGALRSARADWFIGPDTNTGHLSSSHQEYCHDRVNGRLFIKGSPKGAAGADNRDLVSVHRLQLKLMGEG